MVQQGVNCRKQSIAPPQPTHHIPTSQRRLDFVTGCGNCRLGG